jgi:hypothetical protein
LADVLSSSLSSPCATCSRASHGRRDLKALKPKTGMKIHSQIECFFWCAVYLIPRHGPERRKKLDGQGQEDPISLSANWEK